MVMVSRVRKDVTLRQVVPYDLHFSSKHPSFFIVVNHKYSRSMMRSLLSFFDNSRLMKKRTRPRPFRDVLKSLHVEE